VKQPQASPQAASLQGSRWVTVLIVSVGLLVLAGFAFLRLSAGHSLQLGTCFQDVNGLRAGMKVRLAGVEVGFVRAVRAQPANRTCPGEVEMEIRTSYELRIPHDSVASIATAGLLGETYLSIDVSQASGPPVQNGSRLPSKESVKFSAASVDQTLKELDQALKQLSEEVKKRNAQAGNTPPGAKPSPKPSPSSAPK
jgi:phospholipid/cholesterol/gamma-HCH transport system substrate-binding protein